MAEYIDREKILKYIEENNTADEWIVGQYNADWIYSFIENQPTADVEKVVRCKDCVACDKKKITPFVCTRNKILVYGDNFCSYGIPRERRDT